MNKSKLIKAIKPVKLFKTWLHQNQSKFECKPYFFYRKKGQKKYFYLRYKNIINNIVISVSDNGQIDIDAHNLKNILQGNFNQKFHGFTTFTAGFYVVLKKGKDGKYYNQLHITPISYESPEEVYYEQFNLFLEWSNRAIKKENLLFLSWEDWGIFEERLINPEEQLEIYQSYKTSLKDNEILINISKSEPS